MKTITSLNDALCFILEGLYFAEAELTTEFPICCSKINSHKLKDEVNRYIGNSNDKILKLDRVFSYLMKDPFPRQNAVIADLLTETRYMLSSAVSDNLKDVLTIGCIQNINAYKISSYRSAYLLAVELQLDTATDLLQQILEWEIETSRSLNLLSVEEFNKTEKISR